ncbi:hypothetical protein [Paenibacillus sp. YAF4_2]|uniref:hypothetical protein n=1 Tax=Paenibacillus sp. YAF4_2 TaxID=3233085 RepID=UPI003F9B000A
MKRVVYILGGVITVTIVSLVLIHYFNGVSEKQKTEAIAFKLFDDIKQNTPYENKIIKIEDYKNIKTDLFNEDLNKIRIVKHNKLNSEQRVIIFAIELLSYDNENNIRYVRADNVVVYITKKNGSWAITKAKYFKGN